jgi:Zn-dependent protease
VTGTVPPMEPQQTREEREYGFEPIWERDRRDEERDPYAARDYDPIRPGTTFRDLLRKLWAPIAVGIGLLVKFGAATFKFFGIFISVGVYALAWGWAFAVGIVALIFVHEAGHWLEAKRQGLDPSAPVFIPFLGAYVAMKNAPKDPWRNGLVSLAGPLLGGIGAAAVWLYAESDGSLFLFGLAYTAFFLNLINLLPLSILDGGFAWRSIKALRRERSPRAVLLGAYYFGLAIAFAAGMWATHVPQDSV